MYPQHSTRARARSRTHADTSTHTRAHACTLIQARTHARRQSMVPLEAFVRDSLARHACRHAACWRRLLERRHRAAWACCISNHNVPASTHSTLISGPVVLSRGLQAVEGFSARPHRCHIADCRLQHATWNTLCATCAMQRAHCTAVHTACDAASHEGRDRPRAQPEGLSCVGGAGAFGHGPCHQLTHASRLAGGEPIGSLISSCRLSLQVERVACCVQAVGRGRDSLW